MAFFPANNKQYGLNIPSLSLTTNYADGNAYARGVSQSLEIDASNYKSLAIDSSQIISDQVVASIVADSSTTLYSKRGNATDTNLDFDITAYSTIVFNISAARYCPDGSATFTNIVFS